MRNDSEARSCTAPVDPDDPRTTYWERAAESAWGKYISGMEKDAILRAHALAGKPTKAVEIGCEGGRWSQMLAERGWKMTCTDVNAKVLATCQSRLPAASCILVEPSSEGIPCETASMGLMLCIEVPPVIKSSWFPRESARVLAEHGLLVGVFFNRWSVRGLLGHATAAIRHSYDYYELSYGAWRRRLRKSGFAFRYEKGFCWFPFKRASNSRHIPLFVGIERYSRLQEAPELSPWVVFVAQRQSGHI
jgi:SAM-dependent methyltransferase